LPCAGAILHRLQQENHDAAAKFPQSALLFFPTIHWADVWKAACNILNANFNE
jgi:hypothetical protein